MNKKLEYFKDLFNTTEVDKFVTIHSKKCDNYSGYDINLRGTGIGINCEMKCIKCGKICDISNYDNW
jgi:hypothetical protein